MAEPAAGDAARDRTAELPRFVLVCILSLLPVRTAVKCGVLSRAWLAASLELLGYASVLDFGEVFYAAARPQRRYLAAVDSLIAAHVAPTIDRMEIFLPWRYSADLQERVLGWVHFASWKQVKELVADFHPCRGLPFDLASRCLIPGPAFHSAALSSLSLSWCNVFPAFEPKNMPSLQELSLNAVSVTDETIVAIFAGCPRLAVLRLMRCLKLQVIKIAPAPSLRILSIHSRRTNIARVEVEAPKLDSLDLAIFRRHDIVLKDVANLKDARVVLQPDEPSPEAHWALLSALTPAASLTLCGPILLHPFGVVTKLNFINLKSVHFKIHQTYKGLPRFLHICHFPALEQLSIEYVREPERNYHQVNWMVPTSVDPLVKLRTVSIRGYSFEWTEHLKTVEFLSHRALCLETLTLTLEHSKYSIHCYEEELAALRTSLEVMPKANPGAKILIRLRDPWT